MVNDFLTCQYPITKSNPAPRCTKPARWYDSYGWAFCDEHHQDGDTLFGLERRRLLDVGLPLPDGVPCYHPGCRGHIFHPCEGCGRIGCFTQKEPNVPNSI